MSLISSDMTGVVLFNFDPVGSAGIGQNLVTIQDIFVISFKSTVKRVRMPQYNLEILLIRSRSGMRDSYVGLAQRIA